MDARKPLPVIDSRIRERIETFAQSDIFSRLFTDGMSLVEETAAYLDGPGKEISRTLTRDASLSYATVSMEMTTRLMQAASWLVVQRAVKEGDMTVEDAADARFRIDDTVETAFAARRNSALPEELISLVERSKIMFERLVRLDARLFDDLAEDAPSSLPDQVRKLEDAMKAGVFDPLRVWKEPGSET